MKNWKMELAAGGQILAEVQIQEGIFENERNCGTEVLTRLLRDRSSAL